MKASDDLGFPLLEHPGSPLENNNRNETPFFDGMRMYRATIYDVLGGKKGGDDRLQVLPLPLTGIPEDEMKNLPRYPSLIKGTVITGLSIKADGKDKADQVWILATPDFQYGFVVGRTNAFGNGGDKKWPYSYNFKSVRDFLQGRQALPEDFDYSHYDVIRMVMTDNGGMIEMSNHQNGDWILLNTSGSVITVQQQQIYMRVGTPPNPPSAGPVAFSAIKMTPDKIWMKSPNCEIDSKNLVLGHHNLNLLACTNGFLTGMNGVNAVTISNIAV
jgi:hypothetical protein